MGMLLAHKTIATCKVLHQYRLQSLNLHLLFGRVVHVAGETRVCAEEGLALIIRKQSTDKLVTAHAWFGLLKLSA